MERHYVTLNHGQVHYLRAGEGPAALLLHASPMSSRALVPWIEGLAGRFTVVAPDLPGYGQSTRMEDDDPTIERYAERIVDFADAIGLETFTVAGTHTGAKVALALAVGVPERVSQVVMDGLGIYTEEEVEDQLARYTPVIEPNWYGGHLLEAWHRMRNMWTFWPWYRQERDRRLGQGLPPIESLHQMTMDMLRSGPDWGVSYRAAFTFDVLEALSRLRVPADLITKHSDPLHAHLERLEHLPESLNVRSVPDGAHETVFLAAFDPALGAAVPPPAPDVEHRGGTTRRYVRTTFGETHVRLDGDPTAQPVLMIHGSPGSADSFAPLIHDLARDFLVISPDTLGNGWSSPPPDAQVEIDYFARATAATLDALGVSDVLVVGSHTGACIGLELACLRPDLVRGLIADGLPTLDPELREDILQNYWVDLSPSRHGEHLIRAWHVIRDVQMWWPWYRTGPDAIRPTVPDEPARLHELVMEYLKSGPTYRCSYGAAFRYDAASRLSDVQVPVLVCAAPDDMLRSSSEDLSEGRVTFVELDVTSGRDAAWAVRQQAAAR